MHLQDDPDVKLMLAFQGGDEDAFVMLYQNYRDRLTNFTRRMLGSSAQGEEAAQDVFLKLYRAKDSYQPRSKLSTFLWRMAFNHCLNIRARKEHKLVDVSIPVEAQAAAGEAMEERLERNQRLEALQRGIAALPEKQAAALLLCHFDGLSYRDAAEALEVTESALKSLIHRAREGLTRMMNPYLSGPSEVKHAVR